MELLFYSFIFIFATAIGSFLGVIVDRLMNNEQIWKGRSHCDHCRHNLHWKDLIPVISFFWVKRKCRYCHQKLSWFYPLIEVFTGILLTFVLFVVFRESWSLIINPNYLILSLYYTALVSSLIVIFFTDLKYGIIPFKVVIFASVITLLWYLLVPTFYFLPGEIASLGLQTNIVNSLFAALGAFALFFLLFWATRGRGMGFGDVVYVVLMGFVLGFPKVALAMYIAFITGAVVAVLLVLLKLKHFKGGTIPFGPFLVLGTVISLLFGNQIIAWIMERMM